MWRAVLRCARVAAFVAAAGCARDVVLADRDVDPVCGNGLRESDEECDVDSPGCVRCRVAPTWTCGSDACAPLCGDGVTGEGATCAAPRRTSDCDMTGYWAVRETNWARDSVVNAIQTSSHWFLYRFEQEGDAFVVRENLDCGLHVTGAVTVEFTPGMLRKALYANRMDGGGRVPARRGTARRVAAGCEFSLERFYKIRGANPALLPADFSTKPPLASLPPLPTVRDPARADENPEGAVDDDGDGIPGAAFAIRGFVSGVRNAAQRDFSEFASLPTAPVPAGALTFTVAGAFDVQESVLRVTQCGSACGLLKSSAYPANVPGRLALFFIGEREDGDRVRRVVTGRPRANLEADLTTCANVRVLIPHDPSPPP